MYDERTTIKTLTTDRENWENTNRNSRLNIVSNPNESSGVQTFKRTSESLPRPVSNQPNRYTSTVLENASIFLKPNPSTPKLQPSRQSHQQSFSFRPEPFIVNNSTPVQAMRPTNHTNQGSRV